MKRLKLLLPYLAYSAAIVIFAFGDRALRGRFFSIGFLVALFGRRKNLLLVLPVYALAVGLAEWSLWGLVPALLPPVVILIMAFFFYRYKRDPRAAILPIITILLSLTYFSSVPLDEEHLVIGSLSVVASVATLSVTTVAFSALETRGLYYKLSPREWLAVVIFFGIIAYAASPLELYGFYILPLIASCFISFSSACGPLACLTTGALTGLFAAIYPSDVSMVALYLVYSVGVVVGRRHPLISYILGSALFIGADYLISGTSVYLRWVGIGFGGLVSVVFYAVASPMFRRISDTQTKEQGSRFLINRTRQDVARRLDILSDVFKDMEAVLRGGVGGKGEISVARLSEKVLEGCCNLCPRKRSCEECLGDSLEALVAELVSSAIERGKASILDTPPFLSANCSRLNTLIEATNSAVALTVRRLKKEDGNRVLKDVMGRQMGGVGEVLKDLSTDLEVPVKYDGKTERKLISELNYKNVAATDAILFGERERLELTLRLSAEYDDYPYLTVLVSKILGVKMEETRRETGVLGGVTVFYGVAPRFSVSYGEYGLPLVDDDKSGDAVEAVKISKNKIMLLLADGMGSGENAYEASKLAVSLIENFYKAGFSSQSVLYASGRLLSLKGEEDFNAIDLALVDLNDATVDFIKLGGREGYVKSGGNVDVVPCGSLPLGIVDEIAPVVTRRKLADGDMFVIVSDGVADILDREKLEAVLSATDSVNPGVVAESVVKNALSLGGKHDDMTCLVGRIFLAG